ncbi:MAG: peptidylprolyl isomerase [Acidobacteriales bacterium]|nr:peptidylprolyl isomerase [Terriglobales bacterium]
MAATGVAQTKTAPTTTPKSSTKTSSKTAAKTTAKSTTKTAEPAKATEPATPATDTIKYTEPPQVIFTTSKGQIACKLFPDKAPKTVANFVGLALGMKDWLDPKTGKKMTGTPFFENTTFHRVRPNFMVQAGDRLGNGTGSPGYTFEDEFAEDLTFDRPGRLAMANSGPATNGSQFFITEVPTPWLNDKHTIFGQCDDASVEIVKAIARVPTDENNWMPLTPVMLSHVKIIGVAKPEPAPKKVLPRKKKS